MPTELLTNFRVVIGWGLGGLLTGSYWPRTVYRDLWYRTFSLNSMNLSSEDFHRRFTFQWHHFTQAQGRRKNIRGGFWGLSIDFRLISCILGF